MILVYILTMENIYILNYINSNLNLFIDKLILKKNYGIFFSDIDFRPYWNSCFCKYYSDSILKEIEGEFYLRNLNPSFWIDKSQRDIEHYLEKKSYIRRNTDYWMSISWKPRYHNNDLNIEKIVSKDQIDDYLFIFLSEYKDPQFKYKHSLIQRLSDDNINSYILYEDGSPASIISIIENNGIGLIQSVVTKKEFRNKGYASALCRYAINKSNVSTFILRTDINNPGINVYKKIGFKKLFEVDVFSKKTFKDSIFYKFIKHSILI